MVGDKLYYQIPTDRLGKDMLWVVQIEKTQAGFSYAGMPVRAVCDSPITGAKGNREFFVWARKGGRVVPDLSLPVTAEVD